MYTRTYSSKLLESAVTEISKLPGIGERTALRLVLHLMRIEKKDSEMLANSILELVQNISYCRICHNISDTDICAICSDTKRDKNTICIVESIKDVMAIENTHQYNGLYHILGGMISPMDGIGPKDLHIDTLVARISENEINEVIFALSATMEGETTSYYIFKKIQDLDVKTTSIAKGVSFGDELEFTDEVTLGRSILNRIPFDTSESK
jgi:recombination protein RecR